MIVKLSKELDRQEKILYLLLSNQEVWTLQQLADELELSKKTISSYIQQLNIWLKCWDTVIASDSKGYTLNIPADLSIHEIIWMWVKEDIGFQFCIGLFFETIETIEAFTEANYITSNQFYKKTTEVKQWIEEVGLSFETKPDIQLSGKEAQIRYSYFHFFWSTFKGIEWPFSVSRIEIDNFISRCLQVLNIQINKLQAEKVAYAVAICMTRIQQGNLVDSLDLNWNSQEDVMYKIIEDEYCYLLEKENIAQSNYKNECLFLTILVSVISLNLVEDIPFSLTQQFITPTQQKMTGWFLEELEKVTKIKPNMKAYLMNQLTDIHREVYYFQPIKRKVVMFDLGSPKFKKEKKKIRKNIVHTILKRLKDIGKKEGISYFDEDALFLEKNYEALINRVVDWSLYFKPVKIQIETDECIYTNQQISLMIQATFPNEVEVVSPNYKGETDVIITTFNVYKRKKCSVLIWNTIPTNRNLQNLITLLDGRVENKRGNLI